MTEPLEIWLVHTKVPSCPQPLPSAAARSGLLDRVKRHCGR